MPVPAPVSTPSARGAGPAPLGSARRVTLMAALQEHGASTVGELAELTTLHENTVREHLQILMAEGLVRREPGRPAGRGRPRMQYRASTGQERRQDPAEATRLERSIDEARRIQAVLSQDACTPTPCAERGLLTGSPAGDRQVLALFAHLDQMGLEPTLAPSDLQLDLWRCPHHIPVGATPAPACRVHLALAQSVLDQAGGPVEVVALHPHVGPERCVLALGALQGPADR